MVQTSPVSDRRWLVAGVDPLEALARPEGLSVVFQPVVDLGGRVRLLHGVEGLSRGPAGTPLADATILFDYVRERRAEARVDRLCCARVLQAAAALPPGTNVFINVHAVTLAEDAHFVPFLLEQLRAHAMDPRRITIDIIAAGTFCPVLVEAVARLRAVGIRASVDDVGGLRVDYHGMLECRPEYLKLDRVVVRRRDEVQDLLIESLVRLSRSIGARTIVKGIETLDELDNATRAGISLVQGEYFCPAMPLDELLATDLLATAA